MNFKKLHDSSDHSDPWENSTWEGFKAFGQYFWDAGKAIVTGEAGAALGDRWVSAYELHTGGTFDGDLGDWTGFVGIGAGDLVGVGSAYEAYTGKDLATDEALTDMERAAAIFDVIGSAAGGLAGAAKGANATGKGLRASGKNATKGLANEGVSGAPMDSARFSRMKEAFERNGGVIDQSADAQRYLKQRRAGGVTFDSKTVLLPENPTVTAVFEEFIHTAQHRTGRFSKAIEQFGNAQAIVRMEIEAQEKLIRNRAAWGIPNSQTRLIIERLRGLRTELE